MSFQRLFKSFFALLVSMSVNFRDPTLNTVVLLSFSFRREMLPNRLNKLIIPWNDFSDPFVIMNVHHFISCPLIMKSLILLLCLTPFANISMHIMKRYGETGHSCLTPLLMKDSDMYPLWTIILLTFVKNSFIHLLNDDPKLKFSNVLKRKRCDRLSIAFLKSEKTSIPGWFVSKYIYF